MAFLDSLGIETDGRDRAETLVGTLRRGLTFLRSDLLDREFSALHMISFSQTPRGNRGRGETHRQYPQQGGFACILQADHGDIHLCGPAARGGGSPLALHLRGRAGGRMVFPRTTKLRQGSHLPEHPQEPVIDGTKDPSHRGRVGGWRLRTSGVWGVRRGSRGERGLSPSGPGYSSAKRGGGEGVGKGITTGQSKLKGKRKSPKPKKKKKKQREYAEPPSRK